MPPYTPINRIQANLTPHMSAIPHPASNAGCIYTPPSRNVTYLLRWWSCLHSSLALATFEPEPCHKMPATIIKHVQTTRPLSRSSDACVLAMHCHSDEVCHYQITKEHTMMTVIGVMHLASLLVKGRVPVVLPLATVTGCVLDLTAK